MKVEERSHLDRERKEAAKRRTPEEAKAHRVACRRASNVRNYQKHKEMYRTRHRRQRAKDPIAYMIRSAQKQCQETRPSLQSCS